MAKLLIIGAGGVGGVVVHKCARMTDVFSEICLASRSIEKCHKIASQIDRPIRVEALDADQVSKTVQLLRDFKPDLVIHVALPYQDLHIMDACLEAGVHYLDTANYEPLEEAKFCYKWQWDYRARFEEAGLMALLGSGFDPGVTNVFCAHALKHHFDEIHTVDIIDCNAGDHGLPFATNFNPEINIREVTAKGKFFKEGSWIETEPLSEQRVFDFPEGIGKKEMFLMYHEELESLSQNIPGIQQMRFWMTFSQEYLTHLRVLENVGMTRIDPVEYQGQKIVPLQFLKSVLPEPSNLGELTEGKTCIGCLIHGIQDGVKKDYYIYNVCDHQESFKEVKSQAISYTTGVPAAIGARLMVQSKWMRRGVFNLEELDPDPFMEALNEYGLPWKEIIFKEGEAPRIG
jgi:saccharopine dehydrogenase (NAD+, L-lysine-forming)